ncbi:MAG: hypothetical protein ACLR0P_05085 [Oscillospiraceae bacterium]
MGQAGCPPQGPGGRSGLRIQPEQGSAGVIWQLGQGASFTGSMTTTGIPSASASA